MNKLFKKIKSTIRGIEKILLCIPRKIRFKQLLNSDFTIISNNCWCGFVYEYLGLPYKSPFVGLFLFPECYLELLENFQYFISKELIFIKVTESKYYDQIKLWDKLGYPIGLLDGRIEIHFLHYSDEKESKEKWDRRKKKDKLG